MHSAILPAYPYIGIHANHMDIARFHHRDDPGFVTIAAELQRWLHLLEPPEGSFHIQEIGVINTLSYSFLFPFHTSEDEICNLLTRS